MGGQSGGTDPSNHGIRCYLQGDGVKTELRVGHPAGAAESCLGGEASTHVLTRSVRDTELCVRAEEPRWRRTGREDTVGNDRAVPTRRQPHRVALTVTQLLIVANPAGEGTGSRRVGVCPGQQIEVKKERSVFGLVSTKQKLSFLSAQIPIRERARPTW